MLLWPGTYSISHGAYQVQATQLSLDNHELREPSIAPFKLSYVWKPLFAGFVLC